MCLETVFAHLLETGDTVCFESRQRVVIPYCLLTWHHLLFPDSTLFIFLTSSHQVVPSRLLASRAIGVYSLTSDDPASVSLTVFQSSRVARPQEASKAPYFRSLLSCSARSYMDTYKQRTLRPVSEVADTESRLDPGGLYVDPVFQHSPRHYVGFVRDLVKAGSFGFVEAAVEHVGLFFVPKKAGAQMFIIDASASNRHYSRPPSGSADVVPAAPWLDNFWMNFLFGGVVLKSATHIVS